MSQPDKATLATLRMLNNSQPAPEQPAVPEPKPPTPRKAPKVVAEETARTMVYLPLAWKEKFREIAYHERCKENDLSLEAFRDFLRKKGHKV
jgi:hypothetical protein